MFHTKRYYLLTSTANKIWEDNNQKGQQQMYISLVREYKESFFRQIITIHSKIPSYMLTEIAENAFVQSWETFTKAGIEGKIMINATEFSGYFFVIFKRTYFKLLAKEIRHTEGVDEFTELENDNFVRIIEPETGGRFSDFVQKVLDTLSPADRQLIIWRYIDDLTIDDITEQKSISRNSVIKELSRAKRNFIDLYNKLK